MLRDDSEIALDELIAMCDDSVDDYETAARSASDPRLARLFADLAEERRAMRDALKRQVRRRGAFPHDRDADAATAHRLTVRLRGLLSENENRAMIEECERADRILVRHMSANELALPKPARRLVERFERTVEAGLRKLEDARRNA
jgi:uncharacterized protein (TIGR02284 family)